MGLINVRSEIGKLERVLLHKPGKEIENLTPDTLGRLLFDDIPYLKVAVQEHDYFAKLLRDNGAEVFYLDELAAQVLSDDDVKNAFLDELLHESNVYSKNLNCALKEHLLSLETGKMVNAVCAGVRKNEISYHGSSLSDIIKDDYEFYMDPMPNLYFTRDPGACIGNGLSLHMMTTATRRRETLFLKYIHQHHALFGKGETPLWYNRTLPFAIEGGDILVLSDQVVAVGCSERTTPQAIELLAQNLFAENIGYTKILVFEIQKKRAYMHLDTVFTMIDYDKFTVHPGIEQDLNIYEVTRKAGGQLCFRHVEDQTEQCLAKALGVPGVDLIRGGGGDAIVASREQWNDGSNTLAIAPGVVITYERNYVSNELLDKKGMKVITMPSAELSRGRGGPRCMSMILSRGNIN